MLITKLFIWIENIRLLLWVDDVRVRAFRDVYAKRVLIPKKKNHIAYSENQTTKHETGREIERE